MWEYDSLSHHGIMGMRWGVRRFQHPDGSRTSLGRKKERVSNRGSKDHRESQRLDSKGVSNLSTRELKTLTQRQQLEQQYRKLNPTAISQGKSVVKGLLAAGTTIASIYALSETSLGKAVVERLRRG